MSAEHPVLTRLREDHRNIEGLLVIVSGQAAAGPKADRQVLRDILVYMTRYPDVFHHPREEVLFHHLVRRDRSVADTVQVLHDQHKTLEEHARLCLEEIGRWTAGDPADPRLLSRVSRYVDFQTQHMRQEESEVFSRARVVLTVQDWESIVTSIDDRQDPLFGAGLADGYEALRQYIAQ